MLKKSPKHVWSEDGDSLQDYTSAYSEMPGEHSRDMDALYDFKNAQHEKAMKAPIVKEDPTENLRKKGLI
jgi:hypothetical protein